MKKLLSIILSILMVVTMLPFAAYAATSGSCGDGVNFTIKNGTLTISGSGAVMKEAGYNCWEDERRSITKIVIGNGVTLPNSWSLSSHINLTTVEYGGTVATIRGTGVFLGCNKLSSFTLREGVGQSYNAFSGCGSLNGGVKLVDANGNDKTSFYTVSVEWNSASYNFMTVKGNLAKGSIADIPAQDYTGEEIKPAVEVIWNGQTVSSSNYNVTYSNNIEIGTATVTVTGKDANYYTGTLTQTFEIKPHEHDWSNLDGICAGGCGFECAHESFTNGVCNACSYVCPHENFTSAICDVCGYVCEHDWTNKDGVCANGCGETCAHESFTDGVCNACGYICPHENFTSAICDVCGYVCEHDWTNKDGVCANGCGETCAHESYTDGVCNACGYVCPHESIADGECAECGITGRFVTITMNDSYGDGWNGNAVAIKELVDGEYKETATFDNGKTGICSYVLSADNAYNFEWVKGSYSDECSFTVTVDGETVYECANGSTLTDGEVFYIICDHSSYTDGVCDICGIECDHENITDGKCDTCSLEGTVITITMTDSYGDGWDSSAVKIEQIIDGTYTEVATATIENGSSGTFTALLPKDGNYAFSWDEGDYPEECSFTVTVDGETVYECANGSTLTDGEVFYIICDHSSYTDGVCDICGIECQHESYTECVCDTCGYECEHKNYTKGVCDACKYVCFHSFTEFTETVAPKCEETGWEESYCDYDCGIKLEQEIPALEHDWVSGGVERPVQNIDLSWSDGYYYDTCKNDATHIKITGVAKRGDYDTFNALFAQVKGYQTNADLTDEAVAKANKVINSNWMFVAGYIPQNLIENELNVYIGQLKPVAEVIEAGIADGTMLKADYTEIDKAIAEIEQKLADENITDEGKAGLEEIKAQLEAMKADGNTSEADLAELEKALDEYEAELDKGIKDGTLVEIDIGKIADEANKKWKEKFEAEGLIDEYEDFVNNQKATDEALATEKEIADFANSLDGTIAENAENIAKLEEMIDSLFESWENCLRGTHNFKDYEITSPAKCDENAVETGTCWFCGETDEREVPGTALEHIFLDYTSNGDATCTADGTKTAECVNGCGETDIVADEDSKLDHADEDGDKICDDCEAEIIDTCPDCGRPVHEGGLAQSLVCLIIMLIKLIMTAF